jgi:hypothetical protein
METKNEITYPRDVYFNGNKIGTQERNGDITFNDYKIGMQITEYIQQRTYGVTDKDSKGNQTQHVTIITLGTQEDVKSEKKKLELNKRNGQIF